MKSVRFTEQVAAIFLVFLPPVLSSLSVEPLGFPSLVESPGLSVTVLLTTELDFTVEDLTELGLPAVVVLVGVGVFVTSVMLMATRNTMPNRGKTVFDAIFYVLYLKSQWA